MRRSLRFTLAYAALLAAGTLGACASHPTAESAMTRAHNERAATAQRGDSAANTQTADATTASPSAQTGVEYTNMQVQNFVAARTEIAALPAAQQSDQTQIGAVLQRHSLAPDVYNAIQTRSQTDTALANRIASLTVGTNFTDAQLQGFVRASAEIDPLNRQLATATGDQRTQLATQIRDSLARNNLDLQTYNVIAQRSQSDPQIAARITAIRTASQPQQPPG